MITVGNPYRPEEGAKYVLSDGKRTLELHQVLGLAHSATMLLAYLPNEKVLVQADLWHAHAEGEPLPAPIPAEITFYNNVKRLKLDVSRIIGVHGAVGTMADLERHVGPTAARARQ